MYKRQEVYRVQLKARQQRSDKSLQEFEENVDCLTRLGYPEASKDFGTWIAHTVFIDGIRDTKLQVLRMEWYHNSSDAPVHALHFEAAKSANYVNKGRYIIML